MMTRPVPLKRRLPPPTVHRHGPAQLECVEILSLSRHLILDFVHVRELVLGSEHNDRGWAGSRDVHY